MKVAVLGLWHLGSVTAACTAASGVATVGIDDDVDQNRQVCLAEKRRFTSQASTI